VSIQSRAVKQVSLQCGFEGVDRLEGADVMRQPVPLRRSGDSKWPSTGGPNLPTAKSRGIQCSLHEITLASGYYPEFYIAGDSCNITPTSSSQRTACLHSSIKKWAKLWEAGPVICSMHVWANILGAGWGGGWWRQYFISRGDDDDNNDDDDATLCIKIQL